MLKLIKENIPQELKVRNQWVAFEVSENGKHPYDPKPLSFGADGNISDPTTWGSFEQAVRFVEYGLANAVGYAITKEDNLIFVDLDCHLEKCASEEEKQKLKKQYKSMCRAVEPIESYKEQSLSGSGLHILIKGSISEELKTGSSDLMPIEIYNDKRFVIVTGHKLNDYDISEDFKAVATVNSLHSHYFQKKTDKELSMQNDCLHPPIDEPIYTDDEVLEKALKNKVFELLWNDKWKEVENEDGSQKFQQQHYSDFSLIKKLTFYTGNCPVQTDRLFRQSPCFKAYGTNGKWTKYESDIRKDIKNASETCYAVYDPEYYKKVVKTKEVALTTDTNILVPDIWQPDFSDIYNNITIEDEEKRPFKNVELLSILKSYIIKYSNKPIAYIPYLFKEDRNINGATNIVKKVFQDRLKYSYNYSDFYIWNGKQYVCHRDAETLIHPITEVLGLVEHSVFHWLMTNEHPKDEDFEKMVIEKFKDSKKFVSAKIAQDVLKKYKGMNLTDDILTYYQTPYINMQNGTLDLTTRQLFPHNPMYNQNKITNCDYDPDAECPEFMAMLERLLPNQDDRKELQKAFGLCLAKEQLPAKKVVLLLIGPTNTGKSTFLNTIVELLGEYGTSVDNSLLMQSNKDKNVGPEMFDFRENLLITTSETSESNNNRLDAAKIKALSGETAQSSRNIYSNRMEKFKMIGLIAIDSNFKPFLSSKDTGAWERLRLFPFICPVKKKDPKLKEKLLSERAGIFNWLLKGLDMVVEEEEIFETPSMLELKKEYKQDMDITGQFLSECTKKNPTARIQTTILFTAYKNWCKDNGFRDSVRNKFYEDVLKIYDKKKSGSEFFVGVDFTVLGSLYSSMNEKTPQQFAKDKRKILEDSISENLPYADLRVPYYIKAVKWFTDNITSNDSVEELKNKYPDYCEWCIDKGIMPLKVADFNFKVKYIRNNLITTTPTKDILEMAKYMW